MRILVTGATGFIGSYVMEYLQGKKYSVIGCCRKKPKENSEKYILCDLVKEIPEIDADILIHTAAISPINRNEEIKFQEYFDNNVIATKNILKYAKIHKVKKIIYLASVSSFGEVRDVLSENTPRHNLSDYGMTKYIGEKLIKDSNIPYYILILPGVIGKGCKDNWIIKTAKTLGANKRYEYYNGEALFNNILDVNDLCKFIYKLLKNNLEESNTYLLGATDKIRVKEIIEFLKKQLQSESEIIQNTKETDFFYLDVSNAVKAGFTSIPIKEILVKVCNQIK